MADYVRKAGNVQAVKLDPSTGDITLNGVTVHAGDWLVAAEDGTLSDMADADFTSQYEPAPEPAPAETAANPTEEPAAV